MAIAQRWNELKIPLSQSLISNPQSLLRYLWFAPSLRHRTLHTKLTIRNAYCHQHYRRCSCSTTPQNLELTALLEEIQDLLPKEIAQQLARFPTY
ncbi:MAG: hypothetical protein RMY28_034195 [Nostoc sp. ChiSLP01]|nr:hypothetical protein [Nostoc sp. CmiSLP01]MDZ8283482.1 hypothetical protein [Nostoc sp. ChiSLP01]